MAFVSVYPNRPCAFVTHNNALICKSRRAPAQTASKRAVVRMCEGSTEGEETVSLKDLKERLAQAKAAEAAEAAKAVEGGTSTDTKATESTSLPMDPAEKARIEKQKEIDRLRAAEKFIEVDEGKFECSACGYLYDPAAGDRRGNIAAGTAFADLPESYVCPTCRTPKRRFLSRKKVIAGFADNQSYGFGSNTMTGGEKSLLIFGGLTVCALLLLSGYALN